MSNAPRRMDPPRWTCWVRGRHDRPESTRLVLVRGHLLGSARAQKESPRTRLVDHVHSRYFKRYPTNGFDIDLPAK